jgi:hypothetical protein
MLLLTSVPGVKIRNKRVLQCFVFVSVLFKQDG